MAKDKGKIHIPAERVNRRSVEAQDANQRRAPTFDHRLEPRGGARDWRDYLDDDGE